MKNYKYFSIFAILPLMTSCHGFIVDKSVGVKIIDDVITYFEEGKVGYDKFTYTYNHKESFLVPETEEKVIFDRESKFFYRYVVIKGEHPSVYEKWCYVKDSKIFNCHLENSKRNNEGMLEFEPDSPKGIQYDYIEEDWKELEVELLTTGINAMFYSNLLRMKSLGDTDLNVEYSSWDRRDSIAVEVKDAEYVYKCNIDNAKLKDMQYEEEFEVDNEKIKLYEYFDANYERAQITYLNA